ncbi:hypothetical protein HMPREF1565_0100 [Providencia alcalifaciens RIMD 1656011]|nr:hypothetical protein HMPREF1567_1918 [Providencia alcalifaciens PAL-2]EUD04418.1 hypothetical protein HMPREF1565_0100 [Providencia alcalifaciens RIMD 1656011]
MSGTAGIDVFGNASSAFAKLAVETISAEAKAVWRAMRDRKT